MMTEYHNNLALEQNKEQSDHKDEMGLCYAYKSEMVLCYALGTLDHIPMYRAYCCTLQLYPSELKQIYSYI